MVWDFANPVIAVWLKIFFFKVQTVHSNLCTILMIGACVQAEIAIISNVMCTNK